MFGYRPMRTSESLDDTTPLPDLSFDDLLQPSSSTLKSRKMNAAEDGVDDAGAPVNDSLNTLRPKKPTTVHILENKRLSAATVKSNVLASISGSSIKLVASPKAVTAPVSAAAPTKTQSTDTKIIGQMQSNSGKPISIVNTTLKIGSTTIATPSNAATSTASTLPKNLNAVTMTQIKTADGRVLYVQKAATVATPTVTIGAAPQTSTGVLPRRLVSSPAKPVIMSAAIQKAVLSKGVTIASTGLVKAALPRPVAPTTSGTPITIKNITTISAPIKGANNVTTFGSTTSTTATSPATNTKKPAAEAAAVSQPTLTKVQMVRTADGKLIKLNKGMPIVLSNAKPAAAAAPANPQTMAATKVANSSVALNVSKSTPIKAAPTPSNVVLTKSVLGAATGGQVVIKTPIKQPELLNKQMAAAKPATNAAPGSSGSSATTPSVTPVPAGKMLVQSSTGKQIVVSNKNIIKLSPKPGATNAATSGGASAVHAIQLSGKSGVQYVRVLPTSKATVSSSVTTTTIAQPASVGVTRTAASSKPATAVASVSSGGTVAQKVNLVRPGTAGTKIVVKQSGGSIIPLPGVLQTVMTKRPLGLTASAGSATSPSGNISAESGCRPVTKPLAGSLESSRKHKLSDLNTQLKQLIDDSEAEAEDASPKSDAAPEAKKARYVLLTENGKQVLATRPTVHRAAMQSAATSGNSSGSSNKGISGNASTTGKKVYNLIKASGANGVKYMICNTGSGSVSRALASAMNGPYARRLLPIAAQQLRIKQFKAMQQKQLELKQQRALVAKSTQQQGQSSASGSGIGSGSSSSSNKAMPPKQLFDVLKPAVTAPAQALALDALGGLATRRKHCNCSKSQCLKLYCDCFANGEFCQDCTCKDCFNNLDYEDERQRAIQSCLDRNPSAFKPKITARDHGDMRLHNKGCNCKRSGCLKNYCECYEAKIPCSKMCKCVGCRNMEDRPDCDLDALMTAKNISGSNQLLNGALKQDNRTNVYLTDDVIEATIMCMISRIVMHEKQNLPVEATEREVMEELGESLNQIIMFAKDKVDTSQLDDSKVA